MFIYIFVLNLQILSDLAGLKKCASLFYKTFVISARLRRVIILEDVYQGRHSLENP